MVHEERKKVAGVIGRLEVVIEFTPESTNKKTLIKCHRELCEAIERLDFVKELRERLENLGKSSAEH